MKIGIVGSEEKHWTLKGRRNAVRKIIELLTTPLCDITLVSGGCPKGGVDVWAENIADAFGIKKIIYKPDIHQWESKPANFPPGTTDIGYKDRNIRIAESCDVLHCIDPVEREWSGGRWTMHHAVKIGKPAQLHLIALREEE